MLVGVFGDYFFDGVFICFLSVVFGVYVFDD